MRHIRSINAKWNPKQISHLKGYGIDVENGLSAFTIPEDSRYFEIIESLQDAKDLKDKRAFVEFDKEEYSIANKFMLWQGYPTQNYPYDGKDTAVYMNEVFGGICHYCKLPLNEQKSPFVLLRESKLSKKYLFFTLNWAHNYIFTDVERYNNLLSHWGFGKREVLIGKSKKISKNLLQLEIPMSQYKLNFGNSEFGKTFAPNGTELISKNITSCPECRKNTYNNQILDYFPDFEKEADYSMVHTKEWFNSFHQLVISKQFANFLFEQKIIKWNSNYLIPVKNFTL